MASEIVAISDLHLGTAQCRSEALLAFLDHLECDRLLLCGDILDLTNPGSRWPALHTVILERLLTMARSGMRVDVLCGNHDGMLRAFLPLRIGEIRIADRLILDIGGERVLVFHGDAVDGHCATHPWLRRSGAFFYDGLVQTSLVLQRMGLRGVSLVRALRRRLPLALRHIERFELACAKAALAADCDSVLCGHIHVPCFRRFDLDGRRITYRNCGDWVEHATGWSYGAGRWQAIGVIDTHEVASDEDVLDLDQQAEVLGQRISA